jgi:hypothetical protein
MFPLGGGSHGEPVRERDASNGEDASWVNLMQLQKRLLSV